MSKLSRKHQREESASSALTYPELLVVFEQFPRLIPASSATAPPIQDRLGCLVQRPTSHPTGTFFLLIVTHGHVQLSGWLSILLAAPATCHLASHASNQPVGAVWLFPWITCHLSCQSTLLTLAEPVGSVMDISTIPPSQWRLLQPFSWLTYQLVILSPIQLSLAVMLSSPVNPPSACLVGVVLHWILGLLLDSGFLFLIITRIDMHGPLGSWIVGGDLCRTVFRQGKVASFVRVDG